MYHLLQNGISIWSYTQADFAISIMNKLAIDHPRIKYRVEYRNR